MILLNSRCPKCGSKYTELVQEKYREYPVWLVPFRVSFVAWVITRWLIGVFVFALYDWWVALIRVLMGKGHIWMSKKLFTIHKRTFYCHNCGQNFRI